MVPSRAGLSFLAAQSKFLWRAVRERGAYRRTQLAADVRYLADKWRSALRYAHLPTDRVDALVPGLADARVGVVILSYLRPSNIDPMVRQILRCPFLHRVVVSNNNPDVRLAGTLSVRDARLTLVEQREHTRQGIRLQLAEDIGTDFVLLIDDDVLLRPDQLRRLTAALVARPNVPHGITGEARATAEASAAGRVAPGYPYLCNLEGMDRPVDHITRVYALSRGCVRRALELSRQLGVERLADFGNGEDLVMSYSGGGPPWIHDVGEIADCLSWALDGIATYRVTEAFFEERAELAERLRALTDRAGASEGAATGAEAS